MKLLSSMINLRKARKLIKEPRVFDTTQIVARHSLENMIKAHINTAHQNPISIFWSPSGSGKTSMFKRIISDSNTKYWVNEFENFEDTNISDPLVYPISTQMLRIKKAQPNPSTMILSDIMDEDELRGTSEIGIAISDAMADKSIKMMDENGTKCVFVIDEIGRLFGTNTIYQHDTLHINAVLDGLYSRALDIGFKVILLSSDSLTTMNILRKDSNITNMTKWIVDHDISIKWPPHILHQFIASQIRNMRTGAFIAPLSEYDYSVIEELSYLSENPMFIKMLISSYYNVNGSLLPTNLDMLRRMAKYHEEQWVLGFRMISH